MLRENKERQNSFYSALYEKIPEIHILKQIDKAVDFSFINDLLESSYCKHFGRPAKEPEMMMKLLFLQYIYNLSDVKVIEEANCNLAFLWFLGLNPRGQAARLQLACEIPHTANAGYNARRGFK